MITDLDTKTTKRLDYFASLPKGWFDIGQGEIITVVTIEAARKLLVDFSPYFPTPCLFPVDDGSISIEWQNLLDHPITIDVHHDHYDCSVYINGKVEYDEFSLDQIEEVRLWCLQFHTIEP